MEQTERCLWKRWIDTFGECNSIYTHKHKHANRVADTHVSPCFLYIDWATRVCLLNIETNIYANICAEKGRANVEWHTQRVRCGWIFSTCSNNKNKSTLLDTIFTVASPFTNFHSVSTNISVQIYLKLLNFFIIVVTAWVLYFPLVVEIKKKHNYFLFFIRSSPRQRTLLMNYCALLLFGVYILFCAVPFYRVHNTAHFIVVVGACCCCRCRCFCCCRHRCGRRSRCRLLTSLAQQHKHTRNSRIVFFSRFIYGASELLQEAMWVLLNTQTKRYSIQYLQQYICIHIYIAIHASYSYINTNSNVEARNSLTDVNLGLCMYGFVEAFSHQLILLGSNWLRSVAASHSISKYKIKK